MAPPTRPPPTMAAALLPLLSVAALLAGANPALAQPSSEHKFHFFCGSSFADIQADTCADRQWCPSSADDECDVPGHTCFANTPCDARDIENIKVPTYSLSLHSEFRDPTDKMFCGTDYGDAIRTCEAGGKEAAGRHCPDMNCPAGQTCYLDLPCSYFTMTNPAANPFGNLDEMEATDAALPRPGSMESHYFCGLTFQQAAQSCSSQTWCRTGTSQECPNGETCFVSVNAENPACEINALTKKEYEVKAATSAAPSPKVMTPTLRPTNAPLKASDPKNRMFCGHDWNDASANCVLERHCPNGDSDCVSVNGEKMKCFDYTQCDAAGGMTRSPTERPTPAPTEDPTPAPIHTNPTQKPTTAKPSREPTPEPSGVPTPLPTLPPSKRPTHSPLAFDDLRRQFWCGKDWHDAMTHCAVRCPGGMDTECPGEMQCLSGVDACKNEMGMGAYGDVEGDAGDANDEVLVPEGATEVTFPTLGGEKDTAASKPARPVEPAATTVVTDDANNNSNSAVSSDAGAAPSLGPTLALQGPFLEETVRLILYGLDGPLDANGLDRWKAITRTYMEDFFNKYPTRDMLAAGQAGPDQIRSKVYDAAVQIEGATVEMAPAHEFNPLVVGEVARSDARGIGGRRNLRSRASDGGDNATARALQATDADVDADRMIMITYSQTIAYRSGLDVLNEDARLIAQRPLGTPEYRAEYVSHLRSSDFATFGDLEYASRFMYTAFPTPAPTRSPVASTPPPTLSPVAPGTPTRPPQTNAPVDDGGAAPTPPPTEDFGCNLCRPGQYGVNADLIFDGEVSSCLDVYNWFLTTHRENSGPCREGRAQLSELCCRGGMPVPPPTQKPTAGGELEAPAVAATTPPPAGQPVAVLDISANDPGLPPAASLAATFYCGRDWNDVDAHCATATPCPSGISADCPGDERCVAFTNCGGKFAFASDPAVDGGGPNADAVRSTFYCGTSMQFLENVCEGATPCPNGPGDCAGDGKTFGCFAFTGCNAEVDPGSFVGFLPPPAEEGGAAAAHVSADTFYCAATWAELDGMCVDGVPAGARPCPSGDILECDDGQGCFAYACDAGRPDAAYPAASPANSGGGDYSVEDMDLLRSTFFCGTSLDQIDADCANAVACPTGDECPPGHGCFAFSRCGGVDIDGLVDTFGRTDRPTRAPTAPVEQVCDHDNKMSVNVGYWQSWSVYRDEGCQKMDAATFDAGPYTHVVYSFASLDASYRLEAWNGTYDAEVPLYKEFNAVKQRHPGTKTMIAVGGWTHNDPGPMQTRFSQMASSKSNRQTFASSVVQFLRTYGFDGLDLDWEYPGLKDRGGKRDDYNNYVLMVKELRRAFDAAPEPYELTVAIPGNTTKLEMGFDLAGMAPYVDWFNVMAYDLWGSWDPKQIAYSHTDIRMIDEAVEYMSHFIQRSKLVLGLGSYARTYTLQDEDCRDLGCPFDGPGQSGCEGTDGFLPYFEIADLVTSRSYDSVRFDDESQSMVMITDGNRLVSYDNTVSFNRKINYARDMCFRGQMLWAIDMLREGTNPLASGNGNSAKTGDPSDQSFCGRDYQDVVSSCRQPCPSGDSSQCPPGEHCFANTGCDLDNIGAAAPEICRLCPDSSTQGIREWLEVEYDGVDVEGGATTCAAVDMAILGEYAKGSEECDAARQSLGDKCCYPYPENPCGLCRSATEFMDLRALAEVEFEGETMSCFDLSKRLGPEENDSQTCLAAQEEHWDACCYHQCTLCEGQGVKWWNEVEVDDEPLNCGELDAKLYADETEGHSEECAAVLDEFVSECCYDFPDDPCDVCMDEGGKKHTLMPNEDVDYEGSTYTCSEVNNFLSPFDSASDQCRQVKGLAFEDCCFDRCSLCGEGARLDPDVLVEIDGDRGTCADVESGLFQQKVVDSSAECTDARSLHYDACCFEIPSSPCHLCAMDEYMHFTTTIDFNDDEVTCRSAGNHLMEREDMSSDTCSTAKAALHDTCCYSTCNICGEYSLDWDVFVNYNDKDMSCGDFNEIFREQAVVDGSEQCEVLKGEYFDTCCYSSPTTSCQLCKQGDTFYDLNDNVEVDFNGPTTCKEVANFMSRRSEDTDPVCAVTQTSLFEECCYDKCNLNNKPGSYPDWTAEVEMNGNKATCLELDTAIKEAAISKDSDECRSLQDAFSPICSYSIPQNACDICPGNAVSVDAMAEWDGKEMKCSDIKSRISSREEAEGEVCLEAVRTLGDACCIDQCEVCDRPQKADSALTVYHDGRTKACSELDTHFYDKSILRDSEECSAVRSEHSSGCCYTEPAMPCNLCKKGSEYFDLLGTNAVTFMDQKMTCADVSDMMFRREEEDGETCSRAREDVFDACCDTKCSLCAGKGLEAGVKVQYEGRMMTCLEVDLGLGPAAIIAGSDQCNDIVNKHSQDCCYEKPEEPCRMCPGENMGVTKDASVKHLGTDTTCESLSNYLGSREEQTGDVCMAATKDHSEDCCYERCSLCGEGKADWETFVTYEGQSIACGDFEWILRGKNVAEGSDQCDAVKDEFYNRCCYEPPETSCNLCHVGRDYFDVNAEVPIQYQNSPMKCINLYNSLFVREAADSDQCQAAKDALAPTCCFEKCNMCEYGFLDTTAKVSVDGVEMSCSALDMSFSKDVVMEGSATCDQHRKDYADACCYTIPDNPCRVCPSGSDVNADMSINLYGENKNCRDIANKMAISEEASSDTCATTRADVSEACCFEKCPICPDGYNLKWEVDVEYNRATIACGEFEQILSGNAIHKGSQECSALRSTYSSACCYNYATASGMGQATESTLAQVVTTGYLSTNLDTSTLTPSEKDEAKKVFQLLIKNTLESEGVLPKDSKVTVVNIDDNGVVEYEIEMWIDDSVAGAVASQIASPQDTSSSSLGDVATAAIDSIDSTLSNPDTLEAISDEIQSEASGALNPSVSQELSSADVLDFTPEETNLATAGDATDASTTGTLTTNIDTSGLTPQEKEEVVGVVQTSITNALQSEGVLSPDAAVVVTDIDDSTGAVSIEVDQDVDATIDSTLEDISNEVVSLVETTLSDPDTLESISNEIQAEAAGSPVANDLSSATVTDSSLEETTLTTAGDSTELTVTGTLDTNIDESNLTNTEKEEVAAVVESSIQQSLEEEGVLPQESTVTVTEIDDQGDVTYEIDLTVGPETQAQSPSQTTTLSEITDAVVSQIDATLSDPATLGDLTEDLEAEAAGSSVSDKLAGVSVSDFIQGETSVTATGAATGSGPCNLCKAGEIGLTKDILFNGVETSCSEVYKFLSTQAEAGSESCIAGKEALHDECCMRKCDLCSGGGIPDWYSNVSVNGNTMTCLELDGIVVESEIQSGTEQCSQLLEVAAPACCYEPPTEPCNMCKNGAGFNDVMSSVQVEYGGATATYLASKCCYDKCSLCGGLQTNAALSVKHDETQLGCSEFDSYIFASNLIEEGSDECSAFQDEHRDTCCYDIQCSLCAKGDDLFTTKETSLVQYGGAEVTCGEVANFLYQEEMSQGNACLAAQENVFDECCFQQCEMCEAGASINWAASTTFNDREQSCTDVYWLLVSEAVEAGTDTCRGLSQVSRDCCFQVPTQQCTLCKDENGVTYNTRWNKEVTVNDITKTCGDFNTLLATQEAESSTCSMAKDQIFGDCCFAGSDTLVAIANQVDTATDEPCSLCQSGQVGISADVVFNNEPTTCEEVYNFLMDGFTESDTMCKSAQVKLAGECCRKPDKLGDEEVAFGDASTGGASGGEGSVTAEKPKGEVIQPPMEFDTWERFSGSNANASWARACTIAMGALGVGLFMMS
ncbi:hypothetical protein ACHAXT_012546 [Thalassiosira profunda]